MAIALRVAASHCSHSCGLCGGRSRPTAASGNEHESAERHQREGPGNEDGEREAGSGEPRGGRFAGPGGVGGLGGAGGVWWVVEHEADVAWRTMVRPGPAPTSDGSQFSLPGLVTRLVNGTS